MGPLSGKAPSTDLTQCTVASLRFSRTAPELTHPRLDKTRLCTDMNPTVNRMAVGSRLTAPMTILSRSNFI